MLQVGKVADPGEVAAKAGSAASKAKSSVKQEANGAGGNPLGTHLPAATSLAGVRLFRAQNALDDMLHEDLGGSEALL